MANNLAILKAKNRALLTSVQRKLSAAAAPAQAATEDAVGGIVGWGADVVSRIAASGLAKQYPGTWIANNAPYVSGIASLAAGAGLHIYNSATNPSVPMSMGRQVVRAGAAQLTVFGLDRVLRNRFPKIIPTV